MAKITQSLATGLFLILLLIFPTVSEKVDFRFCLGGSSPSSLLLLLLFELVFECFPPSLLILGMKKFVIFDMVTGIKPRKMVRNLSFGKLLQKKV